MASMWQNKSTAKQRTLCLTCCHPACSDPACPTCKHCTNPGCRTPNDKSKCQGDIAALNPKQLPNTAEDVKAYLCKACAAKKQLACMCAARKTLHLDVCSVVAIARTAHRCVLQTKVTYMCALEGF